MSDTLWDDTRIRARADRWWKQGRIEMPVSDHVAMAMTEVRDDMQATIDDLRSQLATAQQELVEARKTIAYHDVSKMSLTVSAEGRSDIATLQAATPVVRYDHRNGETVTPEQSGDYWIEITDQRGKTHYEINEWGIIPAGGEFNLPERHGWYRGVFNPDWITGIYGPIPQPDATPVGLDMPDGPGWWAGETINKRQFTLHWTEFDIRDAVLVVRWAEDNYPTTYPIDGFKRDYLGTKWYRLHMPWEAAADPDARTVASVPPEIWPVLRTAMDNLHSDLAFGVLTLAPHIQSHMDDANKWLERQKGDTEPC